MTRASYFRRSAALLFPLAAACCAPDATGPEGAEADSSGGEKVASTAAELNALCWLPAWRQGSMFRCPDWAKTYAGPLGFDDTTVGLYADNAGRPLLISAAASDVEGHTGVVHWSRIGADGSVEQTIAYALTHGERLIGTKSVRDALGNIYVAGFTESATYLAKFDGEGKVLWSQTHDKIALDIAVAGNTVYLTGYFTAAYSQDGGLLWTFDHGGELLGRTVRADAKGNAYVGGFKMSGFEDGNPTHRWLMLMKLGPAGGLAWQHVEEAEGEVTAIAIDATGELFVTGNAASATGISDTLIAKVTDAGAMAWRIAEDDPAFFQERGEDITLDASGDVVVVSIGLSVSGRNAFRATRKLSPDGKQRWRAESKGIAGINPGMNVHRVLTNPRGEIFVTGENWTVKYDAAGRKAAENKGPATENAITMALDGDRILYTAARVYGGNGTTDVLLTKYPNF